MELHKEFDLKRIQAEMAGRMSGADLRRELYGSKSGPEITFIEGPPTMNGPPHIGHLRGRVMKDYWYRYATLKGCRITFNAGWDAQGLPVELQAQKELGVTGGKAEIMRSIGVEKLVSACKEIIAKYHAQWVGADASLGMSFNQDDAYWTYRDAFIEREWQFLKRARERGILDDDHTVIAYCPSCQVSLSHAEVNQGYEQVRDPSLYYKVRLSDEDAYLVVWTTMPFTLVTDAMVGVHPDEEYCYIRAGGEDWIVGRTRLEDFAREAGIEYAVRRTVRGADLEGRRYVHPLYGEIPELLKLADTAGYHVVVSEDFVDPGSGSGIVHLSPANGEDDIRIARRRGIEVFSPIDDEVKFTRDAGKYAGLFVRDADRTIAEDLKSAGALVRLGRINHKYPLCWRSRHRIVWLARRGWFYKLDRLGDAAVRAAESVEYFYEQPRNRFLGIIKERHPWCISRERFWGCPLPAWNCRDCGNRDWLFSRDEIIRAASELPDGPDFELHRPWIDNLTIRCTKCGGTNTEREPFVLDTWHNSGSAPYSSLTDEQYRSRIPAQFLTEGIDQTRGWAYTLLIENVIMSAAAPYRSFLFQGHVLDRDGNKMSKSAGNVMGASDMLEQYPADLVRFYMMWKSSPIEPLSFDADEMMSRPYQILDTLYNLHLYYTQNSRYDKYGGKTIRAVRDALQPPDIWILSKLQKLVRQTGELNNACRFHESARALEDYIINQLSQTYIPIVRRELWDETESGLPRRHAIYAVLSEVLRTLDIIIHPACPHTSEYLYASTFADRPVLLESWPHAQDQLEDDSMEESFDLLTEAVSVSSAARARARLKRRWMLDKAIVCVGPGQKAKLERLSGLLLSQMNVRDCSICEVSASGGLDLLLEMQKLRLPVTPRVELDRRRVGPRAKHLLGRIMSDFESLDPHDVVSRLADGDYTVSAGPESITLEREDFVVGLDAAEGYEASQRPGMTVLVASERSEEMIAAGLLKDIARRLQALRKELGYNPTDMLSVASVLGLTEQQLDMMREKTDELAFLVRVRKVDYTGSCRTYQDADIDGQNIRIAVER